MNWMSGSMSEDWAEFCARELGVSIVRLELHPNIYRGGHFGDPVVWVEDIETNMEQMHIGNSRIMISGTAARNLYENRIDDLKIMLSIWTPPHWMKEAAEIYRPDPWNKYSGGGFIPYTDTAREQLARYVAAGIRTLSSGFEIPIYALSPQNELDWWHPFGYTESCKKYYSGDPEGPGHNTYIEETKWIRSELDRNGLHEVKIIGPEHGTIGGSSYGGIWGTWGQMKYVEDIYNDPEMFEILDIWCHHDYGIDDVRYYNRIALEGHSGHPSFRGYSESSKPIWMTEGLVGVNTWVGAMYLADKIQGSLIAGEVSAYIPWALGATDTDDRHAVSVFSGGLDTYYRIPTYAFKHFARYIRPGAVRLQCNQDDPQGVSVSAFSHFEQQTLTIVVVNRGEETDLTLLVPLEPSVSPFQVYASEENSYWKKTSVAVEDSRVSISLAANSIVTLYGSGIH